MSKEPNGGRTRLGIYTIAEVFEYIDASPKHGQKVKFRGHQMNMRNTRLLSFRINGIKCVDCGSQGAFFAKERYGNDPPHMNLYGFDKYGNPLLFTRDHIKPKAKGGTNHLYNAQTMCLQCNGKKSDEWTFSMKLYYYYRRILTLFKEEFKAE